MCVCGCTGDKQLQHRMSWQQLQVHRCACRAFPVLPLGPTLRPPPAAYATCRSPRVTYSDRFIPSRATSSRLDFSILDRETAASETPRRTVEKEESNGAYNMLLRSELLGCPAAPLSPEKNGGGGMGGTSASGVHPASPSKRCVLVWV